MPKSSVGSPVVTQRYDDGAGHTFILTLTVDLQRTPDGKVAVVPTSERVYVRFVSDDGTKEFSVSREVAPQPDGVFLFGGEADERHFHTGLPDATVDTIFTRLLAEARGQLTRQLALEGTPFDTPQTPSTRHEGATETVPATVPGVPEQDQHNGKPRRKRGRPKGSKSYPDKDLFIQAICAALAECLKKRPCKPVSIRDLAAEMKPHRDPERSIVINTLTAHCRDYNVPTGGKKLLAWAKTHCADCQERDAR